MTLDEMYDFLDGYVPAVWEEIRKAEEFVAPLEARFTCTKSLVNLDTYLEIIQARLNRLIQAMLGKGEPELLKEQAPFAGTCGRFRGSRAKSTPWLPRSKAPTGTDGALTNLMPGVEYMQRA